MHPLLAPAWHAAVAIARLGARLAPETATGKLARSFALRHGVLDRVRDGRWRDPGRPLVWTHAPSVGEGLQARPVLAELAARHPDWQRLHSFYSPSARDFANRLLVDGLADHVEVLPFDGRREAHALLEAWRPDALVFTKLDVWPVLTDAATRRDIPTLLVSATLAADSGRQGLLARALLRDAYRALTAVGAISDDDAARLVALGARPSVVQVTGDTRVDQVAERAASVATDHPLLTALRVDAGDAVHASSPPVDPDADASPRRTLVAGSTWPADEAPLLATLAERVGAKRPWRAILVPHEPTPAHLAPIRAWADRHRLRLVLLSSLVDGAPAPPWDICLVDRIGVLGVLYALADVAFVGGGFHDKGLHSVLEPAAFGVPVVFGPRHRNAREASLLVAAGAAAAVRDAATLGTQLDRWTHHDDERRTAGAAARRFIEGNRGATSRTVALIESALKR